MGACLLGGFSPLSSANPAPDTQSSQPQSSSSAAVEQNLHTKFPKLKLQNLKPVPQVPGLYEFSVNGMKAYTSTSVDYVLVGELLVKDGDKVVNVTRSNIEQDRSQLFDELPKDRAIKIVYGNGERQLALFEDPHCPFCQTFEHDLTQKGDALNATVYVFLFPLESIHPNATSHAEYIWCSKDRARTWSDWMNYASQRQNQDPNITWTQWIKESNRPETLSCPDGKSVVQNNLDLGHGFGFHQTPILLFNNGSMWPAALPMDKLEKAFDFAAKKQ